MFKSYFFLNLRSTSALVAFAFVKLAVWKTIHFIRIRQEAMTDLGDNVTTISAFMVWCHCLIGLTEVC